MKITKKELENLVKEALDRKLSLQESAGDFTAKRQIIQAAQNASMNFENEMISSLDLVNPDEMSVEAQKTYYKIVEQMKKKIVNAVAEAVTDLAHLPRNSSESFSEKGK